jgi:divinyl protochlorophyllide a 8-vinyl-reductase
VITVADCPLCRGAARRAPACAYYAATFERLFARLVHPRARAFETDCAASGAKLCRFEIDWRRR